MSAINILSKQVSELIAAGEVIERPASVIKELVENAIDAHATVVTVEIKNGGITFMRVADNGTGIERDDVKNAFLRHATSKISEQDDLDSIATLGFRGEALASICAVSRVELLTKHKNEINGTLYRLDGGEETEFKTIGCPQGTTFIVRDLFYNVPARMKFLKKDSAESNSISTLMDRIALSHPEISFTFIRDGKQILKTSGNGRLDEAIFQVFGKQFYSGLIPVCYEFQGIKLTGYISKPVNANRASRSMQIFFVNGRFVRTKTAMAALEQAYRGFIMAGKFPACVINMEMNCSTLDVNVHPAKLEIRFTNERPVYECVYHGVKTALSDYDTRSSEAMPPDFVPTNPRLLGKTSDKGTQLGFSYGASLEKPVKDEPEIFVPAPSPFKPVPVQDSSSVAGAYYRSDRSDIRGLSNALFYHNKDNIPYEESKTDFADNTVSLSGADKKVTPDIIPITDYKNEEKPEKDSALGIDESDYSLPSSDRSPDAPEVAQSADRSVVFTADKKADEAPMSGGLIDSDKREEPRRYIGEAFSAYLIIEYGSDRLMFIDKHAAHERLIYERLKNQHSESGSQLLMEPVPVTMDRGECEAVLSHRDMLGEIGFEIDDFGNGTILIRSVPLLMEKIEITESFLEIAGYLKTHSKLVLSEKMEWIFQNTACRAAIKSGNKNHPEELIALAIMLENNPEIRYCPHGRPIYFFLSKSEIEKSFKRI